MGAESFCRNRGIQKQFRDAELQQQPEFIGERETSGTGH